jgi:hypothetical protein
MFETDAEPPPDRRGRRSVGHVETPAAAKMAAQISWVSVAVPSGAV